MQKYVEFMRWINVLRSGIPQVRARVALSQTFGPIATLLWFAPGGCALRVIAHCCHTAMNRRTFIQSTALAAASVPIEAMAAVSGATEVRPSARTRDVPTERRKRRARRPQAGAELCRRTDTAAGVHE